MHSDRRNEIGHELAVLAVRKNQWAGRFSFGCGALVAFGYLQFNVWRAFGVLSALAVLSMAVSGHGWFTTARSFRQLLPEATRLLNLPASARLEPLLALQARGIQPNLREMGDPLTRLLARLPTVVLAAIGILVLAATTWVALHP